MQLLWLDFDKHIRHLRGLDFQGVKWDILKMCLV